ncbi:class A beta-lactamase-related serine hydrolase [Aquimarina sp. AD10]|uniref:serine hydrolase domain-containing protein n=1 Tax=Aquimarina sp. AD10 TaxID=1714849 RepID=UPI000E4E2016|nr:serine hydrolase domain-containing protein [Aquimarina sp. AD10]AXT61302.1 class A beta-lactamase-related serine hydrolase [Aquimarina sp. AD10]RKN01503.1 class A beta-lactamase-related serine hydrolase [Aquimarina sp. AD10]
MKKYLAIVTPSMLLVVLLFSFISAKQPEHVKIEHAKKVQFPQPESAEAYFPDIHKRRLTDAIKKYFDKAVKNKQIVGASVAIVKCDSIIYSGGFGHRNIALKNKVNSETVFRIGSVSKGFAGILAGIHVEDGLINWEDRIVDHIPSFKLANKTNTDQVTISNVLSHTSGLPYHSFTNLVEDGLSLSTIAGRFNEVLPLDKPGSIYNYQNAVFALSGEIIERKTGKLLKDIIQERIFNPLQMETASASYEALQESDNVALPHQKVRYGWRSKPINKKYYNAVAAGGVNASARDMGKWMKFLLGNNPEVLMPKVIEDVFTPVVQVGGRRNYYQRWPGYKASFYGMGWRIHEFKDDNTKGINKVIHHGGGVNNYRSEIALFPNEDLGICVLFNSPNKLAKNCIPELHKIIEEVLNIPTKEVFKTSLVAL